MPWKMYIGNNERNIKKHGKTCCQGGTLSIRDRGFEESSQPLTVKVETPNQEALASLITSNANNI